ncbi:hypothetical protein HRG_003415 [Hirsutella rhossiliensis]|uniref:Uncharacterized protein n=1 Tax=Hirsutella rhossiliensis TaxID=111463 RepID=A0A9P8N3Y7_9HYPO|nr:uncharacterized protein HRG_03415 [Hirsutella rhossiliensis]KAH0965399.1 hypothetical protein HRG_03415 [Hirsutella rhossiliensis]
MAKIKPGPSLKLSGPLRSATNPTSPPETPTGRKPQRHHHHYRFSRPLSQDPNIKPVGNGHHFSYQPVLGPEQLSPRSSSSSDPADESDSFSDIEARSLPASYAADVSGESDSDDNDSEAQASDSSGSGSGSGSGSRSVQANTLRALDCDFVIEDVDPMDSACEGLDVLFPTEIESIRSRSRSSRHKGLDRRMMQDLRNLNCSNEASESDPPNPCDDDQEAFLQRRQELRRHRRVSMSSSFGKRTHSELSDSDNDEAGSLDVNDVNDVGSSARRLRKRLHRGSLLFQDPPEPRIDELDEPDSGEDNYAYGKSLARELPYYTMEIMEMESS